MRAEGSGEKGREGGLAAWPWGLCRGGRRRAEGCKIRGTAEEAIQPALRQMDKIIAWSWKFGRIRNGLLL